MSRTDRLVRFATGVLCVGLALVACAREPARVEVRVPPWPDTIWVRDDGFPNGYGWSDPRAAPAGAVLAGMRAWCSFDEAEWSYALDGEHVAQASGSGAAPAEFEWYRVTGRQRCVGETWWAEARRVVKSDRAGGR